MSDKRRILIVDPSRVARAALVKHLRDDFDIREENGKIVIEPVKSRYCLDQLLSAITDDNLHQEISSGEPVGKELL